MTDLPYSLLPRVVLAQTGKEKRKTVPAPLRLTPFLLGGNQRANAFGACTFKPVLLLPGELAKHAASEGTKAVTKYTSSK